LPAMNDDAIFLTFRVGCIAGKPPPTVVRGCKTWVHGDDQRA